MNDHERLESLYDAFAHRVYAYALRHCGPNDADDVLSETFAVAWRRIDVVPEHSLPWLLTTAANLIRNGRRRDTRQSDTARRLAALYRDESPPVDEAVAERHHLLAALERLTALEREALLLTAWDGLDISGAAAVSGCAPRAFRARLSRARARLAAEVAHPSTRPSSMPSATVPKEIHP
jgi:RNA polymerase sigma factor (sigma-70 family)